MSLTGQRIRSTFVLMEVETLGVARSLGWKVHMRCANGYREGTRSMRRCVYRKQLDLETLVTTRGTNFPLSRLESRLMCPACGNRRVTVVFEPPSNAWWVPARQNDRSPTLRERGSWDARRQVTKRRSLKTNKGGGSCVYGNIQIMTTAFCRKLAL